MPHVRTKPNGSIQIIYRNPLKRKYEYRNFPPKTPNKVIKAELLKIGYEIQAHKTGIQTFSYGQKKIDNLTLGEFRKKAFDEEREKNVSPKTFKRNRYAMRLFTELLGPDMRVNDITDTHVSQFKLWVFNKRDGEENSKKLGVNKELSNLSAIFNYALKKGYVSEIPKFPKFKVARRIPDVLNCDEILRVSQNLDGDYLFAFQILMLTGARRGALVREKLDSDNGLKWQDIDWFRNTLTLRDKGKEKTVPMSDDLREILVKKRKDLGKSLNPEAHVIRFTQSALNQRFKKVMRKAGINKKGSIHILRHSWATEALKQGANIREVQEWLGHTDISTTQIYTHIVNEQLQNLAKKIKIAVKK